MESHIDSNGNTILITNVSLSDLIVDFISKYKQSPQSWLEENQDCFGNLINQEQEKLQYQAKFLAR